MAIDVAISAFSAGSAIQKTTYSFFLLDVSGNYNNPRPVANISPDLACPQAVMQVQSPPNLPLVSSTEFYGIVPTRKNSISYTYDLVDINFTDTNRWQPVELGDVVNLSAGVASYYDGARVAEQSFLYAPFIMNTVNNTTGGTLAAGNTSSRPSSNSSTRRETFIGASPRLR